MNDDKIKGKFEKVKGDIKERVGGATKDRSMQGEGWLEEKKGSIREGIGEIKEGMERKDEEKP